MSSPVDMATLKFQMDNEFVKAVDALVQASLIGLSLHYGVAVNYAPTAQDLESKWNKTLKRLLPNVVEDYIEATQRA